MASRRRVRTTNTSNIGDDCRNGPCPVARIRSGGVGQPCLRRLLASITSAFARHQLGATELRDLGRTITHRPCGGRADDDRYAASPAAAERARAVDGRRPIGHVVAADREARKALVKATGGVYGAVDFVGSDGSLAFAAGSLAKGGKVVITGLLGGTYTTPIAMFPLRVFTIEGTMTGTLDEANEMMALARAGKVPPVPITERPLSAAQASLDDLRGGRVVGRVVLVP